MSTLIYGSRKDLTNLFNFTFSICILHSVGCSGSAFLCSNMKCVMAGNRCDGDNDCGDMSDEMSCGT